MVRNTLDYGLDRRPKNTALWLQIALSFYPVALIAALHGLYVVEWINNGELPIPPHHGADGLVESTFYWLAGVLYVAMPLALSAFPVVAAGVIVRGVGQSSSPGFNKWALSGLAMWAGACLLLVTDPFHALYFFMD